MIDRRTKLGRRQKKVMKQAKIILMVTALLAITLGIAYAQAPSVVPVSPLGPDSLTSVAPQIALVQADQGEAPALSPSPLSVEDKIMKAWGKAEGPRAWKIVSECENKGLDPKAINHNRNGTLDVGIFQVNTVHGYSKEWLMDVDNNIEAAYKIYQASGWSAWSCSHVIGITPFYAK